MGQCFSALDEIWGGGATVSLDGGTNGEGVGAGQGDGDKAFVLFYALFGGSAVFHDLFNGDVEHDFFLFDDNGRAHALGVFWKGSAGITVFDPGPGFAGVELEQDLAVGEILIHSLVIQHGHVEILWTAWASLFRRLRWKVEGGKWKVMVQIGLADLI